MTITQTVEIPADRRLHLNIELPKEMPAGEAHLEVKVIPFVKKSEKELASLMQNTPTPHTDRLFSLLAGIGEVNPDEIRDARLAKHLP